MIKAWTAILALLLAATQAEAESLSAMLKGKGGNSCWSRTYSAAELSSHPKQQVADMVLSSELQEDGGFAVSIYANFRKRVRNWTYDYAISGFCKPKGQGITCIPEWDAGTFVLEKGARGGLRVRNQNLMFNPSNFDSEEIAPNAVDMSKSDDAIWLLFPADEKLCSVN